MPIAATTAALIVAAGQGSRTGLATPKQYVPLAGETILQRTLSVFLEHAAVDCIIVVIAEADRALYDQVLGKALGAGHPASHKLLPPAVGGATRQQSVLSGLRALRPHQPMRVLIHDAARPFVAADVVHRVLEALDSSPAAVAALPVTDTLKRSSAAGQVAGTVERTGLWRAQTPQGFRFESILAAHEAAAVAGHTHLTDDAAVAEWAGLPVALVPGSEANMKVTTAEDMARAACLAQAPSAIADVRTGQGFDVHRFSAGDHVWLCGVPIPHSQALEGHSDADVALHALTDALLGAIGDGDIGQHFPPSDPRWRGAASHLFLADAARRVRACGGTISNVDVTILCEMPRIGPHRQAMRSRIAEILAIDMGRVGVKATTTEGLGFTGRREGIAALATATVLLR